MTFFSPFIVGSLSGGRQGGSFAGGVVMMMMTAFAQHVAGATGTAAALAGDAQLLAQLRQGVTAGIHRGADVAVGNGFADADVHGGLEGRELMDGNCSLLRSILNKIRRSVNSAVRVGRAAIAAEVRPSVSAPAASSPPPGRSIAPGWPPP